MIVISGSFLHFLFQMTRACIIDDAITYISKMQSQVESLTQELQAIEAVADSSSPPLPLKAMDQPKEEKREGSEEEEMKKCGIQVNLISFSLIMINYLLKYLGCVFCF